MHSSDKTSKENFCLPKSTSETNSEGRGFPPQRMMPLLAKMAEAEVELIRDSFFSPIILQVLPDTKSSHPPPLTASLHSLLSSLQSMPRLSSLQQTSPLTWITAKPDLPFKPQLPIPFPRAFLAPLWIGPSPLRGRLEISPTPNSPPRYCYLCRYTLTSECLTNRHAL